ncbi:MAG: hypothetical protein ABI548_10430 [Polyangiaceae bacterium]
MMRAFRVQVLAPVALSVGGCVPNFDDNLSTIEQPQVLAVQAEPAEVAPGESVQLNALVATPAGNAAVATLTWGLCIARKPLTELGPVNTVCIQAPSAAPDSIVALGSGASVKATLPMDACRLFGPSLPEPMNGEPAGRPVDPDPTGGFYQPVTVTLLSSAVTTLGAVRIFCPPSGLDQEQAAAFTTNYRRNQNPALDSVSTLDSSGTATAIPTSNVAPLEVSAGQVVHFQAAWSACSDSDACTGAETYLAFNADTRELDTKHESLRVSWYAAAGTFAHAVTGQSEDEFAGTTTDNTWTAPTAAGEIRLWLVIRDSRGGQSSQSFVVSMQP